MPNNQNRANHLSVYRYRNEELGLEVEAISRVEPNLPVYTVNVNIIPGEINMPEIIFGAALEAAYAYVLRVSNQQRPHPHDAVSLEIFHDEITSHANTMHFKRYEMVDGDGVTALESLCESWIDSMQSAKEKNESLVDLSHGSVRLTLMFELSPEKRLLARKKKMGANSNKKRAMYSRSLYNDFYIKCDSLKFVPSSDNYCFPMAFIYSRVRSMTIENNGVASIVESTPKPKAEFIRGLHRLVPINESDWKVIKRNLPELVYTDYSGYYLLLFNPYKRSAAISTRTSPIYILDEGTTTGVHQSWVLAAKSIHAYVEHTLGYEVDRTSQTDCIPAYAQVFQVIIHIHRAEVNGEETETAYPTTIQDQSKLNHIYIMFGDGDGNPEHVHAVTNIRSRFHEVGVQNDIGPYNFCDFCGKYDGNRNQSVDEGKDHLTKCYHTHCETIKQPWTEKVNTTEHYEKSESKFSKFFPDSKGSDCLVCGVCKEKGIKKSTRYEHLCYMPKPEAQKFEIEPNIWVWDLESSQNRCIDTDEEAPANMYLHVPNCICLRSVYKPELRFEFFTMDEFCIFILDDANAIQFYQATFFAHNGGSYDDQFLIQYLERNCISYVPVPRPGSSHKYLEIKIPRANKGYLSFKDFIVFIPASLKNIGESFGLSILKGDFPHKFNNGYNTNFIGPIPPIDTPDDFFCIQTKKSKKEIEEMKAWHAEQCQLYCHCTSNEACNCTLPKWNFQTEIKRYCWLDVDVLAEAIKVYRTEHIAFGDEGPTESGWKPTALDPLQYYTQSQAAMQFFLTGYNDPVNGQRAAVSKPRNLSGWSNISIIWMEQEKLKLNCSFKKIYNAANSFKEPFERITQTYVDGFAPKGGLGPEGKQIYQFHGCYWHGCPKCNNYTSTSLHPTRNIPWQTIYNKTVEQSNKLRAAYGDGYSEIWECQFIEQHGNITDKEKELCNIILDREMFYGGRTEVFSPYAKVTDEFTIEHYDVCSMYPTVCAHKMLPTGHPQLIFGSECHLARLNPNHPDAYFGYVRCHVIPNTDCVLGLLPSKTEDKLQFDLKPKTGVWFTAELHLALKQGYVVTEIYEVYHFDESNRSGTYIRDYISFFLRMKQESEGWKKAGASSETPSVEEQERIIEEIYQQNGCIGRMRADKVAKNPVKRQTAKLMLNCLWGKFAQNDADRTDQMLIYTHAKWMKEIKSNTQIKKESVRYREVGDQAFMVYYKKRSEFNKPNKKVNVWIASAVTAWARCILHEQMLAVGPHNVLYCDTDSVVFLKRRDDPRSFIGRGLGQWTDECEEGHDILKFMGLAPKSYLKVERNIEIGTIKAKGIQMTYSNQVKTTPEIIEKLLEEYAIRPVENPTKLFLDNMTIFANTTNSKYAYASVFTRYAQKQFQVVLSKRQLIPFPYWKSFATIQDIDRIYLAPKSNIPIEENRNYNSVYSRYVDENI